MKPITSLNHRKSRRPLQAPVLGLAVAFLTGACLQAQILIDFETFPGGGAVPGGTAVTAQYASQGVVFTSVPVSGASQITTIVDYVLTVSGHNILGPNGPAPNIGGTLILDFATPVSSVSSYFIDDNLPVHVTAFDVDHNIVGTATSDGSNSGFDSWQIVFGPGIAQVQMAGGFSGASQPDGWGIDDLQFTQVPEPSMIALAGLGGLAWVCPRLRRQRGN